MLISVRCFRSSSMAGEESPPDGRSIQQKQKGGGGGEEKEIMRLRWLWGVGDSSAICPHSPPVWRAEESHDRLLCKKVPGGCVYWTNKVKWRCQRVCSDSPVLRDPVRLPAACSGFGVQCSWGGLIGQLLSGRKHSVISWLPSGVVAHQTLCCPSFCSPLLSSLSWDRSARCDCVQVNLLRCQGDADRCPGHVSQYVCTYFNQWTKNSK